MNKKLKVLALPVLGMLALTSCNGGGNGGDATKSASLSIWTGFGTSMTSTFEGILSDYQKGQENLTVTHTSQGGYDNLLSAVVSSVSTSTYPNLAVAYPDHMAQYNESGILYNLTSSISKYDIDLSDYYEDYLKENQEIVEGSTMGLPFNKSTEVLTTNKTFVEALVYFTASKTGDDKITKVPSTWQEVETFGLAAKKVLKEIGAYNKVIGRKDGVFQVFADSVAAADAGFDVVINLETVDEATLRICSYDSQANFFITMVRQWGGTYTYLKTLSNGKKQGYMGYKSSETITMLKFFNRLFREGIIGIPETFGESSYTSTPFKACKTIFTIGSSAGVSNCVEDGQIFDVEVNPIPYNAERSDCKYVISQGTNLVMFKNTDATSREESIKLLKQLSYDGTTNATFCSKTGYLPVTKSAYNSSIYQNFLNQEGATAITQVMVDAAKTNFTQYQGSGNGWTQYVDPGFVGSSGIRSNISGIMAACRDVSEADANNDSKWNELLDTYYQLNQDNIPA